MGRGPRPAHGPADLRLALRWLRLRRQLSQREVVEAVRSAGERLSLTYLKQIELGHRRPSDAVLDAVLAAVASDRAELDAVLAEAPWRELAPGRARAGGRPAPADYSLAARWALSEPFSSPVEAAEERPPPAAPAEARPDGLAELTELYLAATPAERRRILDHARRLTEGRGDSR